MHICHIISVPFPPQEGIGNFVYGISKKLIEKGHSVTVITRGSLPRTRIEVFESIQVIKVPFIPIYPFHLTFHGFFLNGEFAKRENTFDLVHIHTPLCPVFHTKIPIIVTVHTPMLTDSRHLEIVGFRSIIGRIMARFVSYPNELKVLKKGDLITSVSEAVAVELQEYGLDKKRIIVIRNGVDESVFYPPSCKGNEKYILYTGRLSHRKGLFDFIESAQWVLKDHPNIHYIIPGKGELQDQLKSKVKQMGLEAKIKFLGFLDKEQIITLYQNAIIFVMPSHYEGLPTVLLEAMACGLPVIATDIGGNNEVITSYQNGILVPPKSPVELAKAIEILLHDEDLRRRLGNNARDTIIREYTWEKIAGNTIDCYRRILG
ncbi:MAG: glycosyltransferase family 4 protein [Methanoregula sp.]